MSFDYSPKMILGVKLDWSKFYEKTKKFDHNYPEDFEFDPKSGKPLWGNENRLPDLAESVGLEVWSSVLEDESDCYVGVRIPSGHTDLALNTVAAEVSKRLAAAHLPTNVALYAILS